MTALLSTTYFGPVQWYQKLYRHTDVLIEHHDSYLKQTYRNRCLVATTQGVQALTVPVSIDAGGSGAPLHPQQVRISDHGNWRHQHWQALVSAYGDSPFFQYYADDLQPFFTQRWELLYDFNEAIRQKLCELLCIEPRVGFTTHYLRPASGGEKQEENTEEGKKNADFIDFREAIHPKHPLPDADFRPKPYYQVYQARHGFLPNLSILDLLFNMGNEAVFYL